MQDHIQLKASYREKLISALQSSFPKGLTKAQLGQAVERPAGTVGKLTKFLEDHKDVFRTYEEGYTTYVTLVSESQV